MRYLLILPLACAACGSNAPLSPTAPPAPRSTTPVYVVIGDSIAMGETARAYTLPPTINATVFRKDHAWTALNDPTDLWSDIGSFWPLVAPALPSPSQWITVAQGGTNLHYHWKPGPYRGDLERTSVSFEALHTFVTESGVDHVTAFLCHLGANDVLLPEPLTADAYFADLRAFARALADRWPGSVLYLADLGDVWTGHVDDRIERILNIRAAIERAWRELPTVRQGPMLRDLTPDDGVHFRNDASAQLVARRWIEALRH